jgi:predicted transcriptional regulator
MDMKKTTVYLSQEQIDELDALANRTGKPKARLIREAVAEYIVDQEPELPKWIGMIAADDEEVTSENFEGWLIDNWKSD